MTIPGASATRLEGHLRKLTVDIEVLAAELNAAAEFLSALADGSPHVDLTWDPLELKPEIDKIWNTMYGGWRGLST